MSLPSPSYAITDVEELRIRVARPFERIRCMAEAALGCFSPKRSKSPWEKVSSVQS